MGERRSTARSVGQKSGSIQQMIHPIYGPFYRKRAIRVKFMNIQ